jgi:uncharacterized protein
MAPFASSIITRGGSTTVVREAFERLQRAVADEAIRLYGETLCAAVVFGSVARGTARPDSDLDILIVARRLPDGRMARVRQFEHLEAAVQPLLDQLAGDGVHTRLSPVFKTPDELERGTPLLFDMVEDARVLFDRDGYFVGVLGEVAARLRRLGARRIRLGSAWYWDLKPDFKRGEVFEV